MFSEKVGNLKFDKVNFQSLMIYVVLFRIFGIKKSAGRLNKNQLLFLLIKYIRLHYFLVKTSLDAQKSPANRA